jgi:hypothetical protein
MRLRAGIVRPIIASTVQARQRYLFLAGHGAEQSDQPLRRSPGIYYSCIKEAPESGSNNYPPCAISPCERARGIMTQQDRAMTTKNLALAASIMMLATISGQALAGTAAPKAQYWRAATGRSDHRAVRAFNAIDPPMATQTMEPNAHRYHGGPKYND